MATDLNVEILGVNSNTDASFNSYVTQTSGLPWLQDTVTDHVWSNWNVAYRDVQILDGRNRVRAVYNLTTHNLDLPVNREALKTLFLKAARAVDADADGLLDDWEEQHWGSLDPRPHDDFDDDGADNALEFGFGSDPRDGASHPSPVRITTRDPASSLVELSFRRRAGAWLDYAVQGTPEVGAWALGSDWSSSSQAMINQFDGTGTAIMTLRVTSPPAAAAQGFLRLRVMRRP